MAPLHRNSSTRLRVAVPNKGALSEPAVEILAEAGYRRRTDPKDLTVIDPHNHVEFFFLRPKDIPIYVGSGELDFGITGRDLARESRASVHERLALGFGSSSFRYAAPAGRDWTIEDLAGRRIATAYPNLVREDLAARGIDATVIRLDGAVEISVQLGVADAIADVVGSGRTLNLHNLVAFGETLCDSEAVLIEQFDPVAADGGPNASARDQLVARVQGVVFGQQYLMLDYDCPRSVSRRGHLDHAGIGVTHHRSAGRPPIGWRCGLWCRAGTSTRPWTSWPLSGRKRSWRRTSGSAGSDHECAGGIGFAVLASR